MAFIDLLGSRIWQYTTFRPSEVLDAIERRARDGGGGDKPGQHLAIQKKVLQTLPLLVSSTADAEQSRFGDGGRGGDRDGVPYGVREAEGRMFGRERERGAAAGRGGSVADEGLLADAALDFLSREISMLPSGVTAGLGGQVPLQGSNSLGRIALTTALLDILEACYGRRAVAAGDDTGAIANDRECDVGLQPTLPESWPWNSGTSVPNVGGRGDIIGTGRSAAIGGGGGVGGYRGQRRQWPLSWPVRSLPRWGPQLADAAGARRRDAGEGGGADKLVERASDVVELVLHKHAGAAWRKAIIALRGAPGGSASSVDEVECMEEGGDVLPICGPLLERICLELPLMDLTVRVHAAVFQAHGWLSLLPCGECQGCKLTDQLLIG